MRSEEEVNRAIGRYADTVRRLCVIHLKNQADTEDIFQDVFLKYVLSVSKKSACGVLFRNLRCFPLGLSDLPGGKQRKEALRGKARIRRTCRRIRIAFGGLRPSKPPKEVF